MVNFQDPTIIEKDLRALKDLYLITAGIYIWEYLTTLDYEINIIRGRRPYRWTIWIYSFARITALATVIINLVDMYTTTPIDCQAWIILQVLFGYLSIFSASLLIVIRIKAPVEASSIAIWNNNKIAFVIASSVWVTSGAVSGRGIALLRSEWSTAMMQCAVLNSETSRLNIIVLAIADIVLLLTVLIGLFRLRLRSNEGGTFGIGRLLWKQGVIWLLVATLSEVPSAVFINLNLNGPLNLLFQLPSGITMSIAATRMYRSLSDFVSSATEIAYDDRPKCDSKISESKWNQSAPIAFNQIEVTVDSAHEQSQRSWVSPHDLYKSKEEQPWDLDKPHRDGCEP